MRGNNLAYPLSTYTFGEWHPQECKVEQAGYAKRRYAFVAVGMFATVSAVAMAFVPSRIEGPVAPLQKLGPASFSPGQQTSAASRVQAAPQAQVFQEHGTKPSQPSIKWQAPMRMSSRTHHGIGGRSFHLPHDVSKSRKAIAPAPVPSLETGPFSDVGKLTYEADLHVTLPANEASSCPSFCFEQRNDRVLSNSPVSGLAPDEKFASSASLRVSEEEQLDASGVASRPTAELVVDTLRSGTPIADVKPSLLKEPAMAVEVPAGFGNSGVAERGIRLSGANASSPFPTGDNQAGSVAGATSADIDLPAKLTKAAATDLIDVRFDRPETRESATGASGKNVAARSSRVVKRAVDQPGQVGLLDETGEPAVSEPLVRGNNTSASLPSVSGERSKDKVAGNSDAAAAPRKAVTNSIFAHLDRVRNRYAPVGGTEKHGAAQGRTAAQSATKPSQINSTSSVAVTTKSGSSMIVHDNEFVSIKLGELISLFEAKLDRPLFVWMKSSSAASKFVTADTLAAAGIMTSYDPVSQRLVLTLAEKPD